MLSSLDPHSQFSTRRVSGHPAGDQRRIQRLGIVIGVKDGGLSSFAQEDSPADAPIDAGDRILKIDGRNTER